MSGARRGLQSIVGQFPFIRRVVLSLTDKEEDTQKKTPGRHIVCKGIYFCSLHRMRVAKISNVLVISMERTEFTQQEVSLALSRAFEAALLHPPFMLTPRQLQTIQIYNFFRLGHPRYDDDRTNTR